MVIKLSPAIEELPPWFPVVPPPPALLVPPFPTVIV
jgi:hypothetical protein